MLRQKNKVVNIRLKISKSQLLRLFVFAALLGFAFVIDNRWEKESLEITDNNTQKSNDTEESGIVYFFVQCNTTFSAKVLTHKTSVRKFFQQSHDKFIQKYHQLRNYRLLKCEVKNFKKPFILILNFLEFKNGSGNLSDEIPLIS